MSMFVLRQAPRFTDTKVSSTTASATRDIADMILRKQNVFTERRIFPYVTKSNLRIDLLERMRIRAQNFSVPGSRHPWIDMDDDTLLRSGGRYADGTAVAMAES